MIVASKHNTVLINKRLVITIVVANIGQVKGKKSTDIDMVIYTKLRITDHKS